MKQKRLNEVRALISGGEFQAWWGQLNAVRDSLREAEARYEELLGQCTLTEFRAELTQKNAIDTLYRAGEHEDVAANMLFEATELENKSFKGVADFEEQRIRASDTWYRLGAMEKHLEEAREKKHSAGEVVALEKGVKQVTEDYSREDGRKARLWDEVERLWARSAEVNLLVSEQRALGKKVRRQAEELFGVAEERKQKTKELKAETEGAARAVENARARRSGILEEAREKFGCSAGTDFLYFRHRDDQRSAYCIALLEDRDSYNLEVKPLAVYQVDRARGVAFLEPARAASLSQEEGDLRFEEYFLRGRKGEVSAAGG
jgi:hypothetical protein